MKTLYKNSSIKCLLILLLMAFSLVSCNNKLNETVYSNLTAENFWQSETDALAGLYSTYTLSNEFGAHNRVFFQTTDMITDDMDYYYAGSDAGLKQLQTSSYSPLNTYINTVWVALYKTIAQSNVVIEKVPHIVGMTAVDQNTIIGEARFLRALEYFYLVQLWGAVPLDTIAVSNVADTKIPKSLVDTVYKLIVSDLKFAETNCADNAPELGRATKWAAKSLLGKVYLTMAGPFSNRKSDILILAEAKLKEVINSKRFSLVPNIISYFDITKKGSSEAIYEEWQLGDVSPAVGSFMHRNCLPANISNPAVTKLLTPGYSSWSPTPDLWSKFNPKDDRLKMYYTWYIKRNSNGTFNIQQQNCPYIAKYVDSLTLARDAKANNLPIIRYSDVLLIYAEVLNELNTVNTEDANHDQYYYINLVRQRAFYSQPTGFYAVKTMPQSNFRDTLMLERRLELAHEGQRLFDMKRTGTFISGMNALAANNRALLASTPPTFKTSYPAGSYPNPTGTVYYNAGTYTFIASYFASTKMVGPQPYQILYPIPYVQLQVYDIGQNTGYN